MSLKSVGVVIGLLWLGWTLSAVAQEGFATGGTPLRYDVYFGAVLGRLEPVAGTVVCDARRDCAILLSIWPKIEIRLHASTADGGHGSATVDCPAIDCESANGMTSAPYGSGPNDLTIYRGRNPSNSIFMPLVVRSRETLGHFQFALQH